MAGVTKQTISAHLAKLLDAGLVAVESQGRHRYFRLADRDVAHLIESLMGVAFRTGAVRVRASPREPALRKARVCYDHLAGEVGVRLYENLLQTARAGRRASDGLVLTAAGERLFREAPHRHGGARRPEARVLPGLPRLERAPPPSGRRIGRGAPRALRRARMGEARAGFARRDGHRGRRAGARPAVRRACDAAPA